MSPFELLLLNPLITDLTFNNKSLCQVFNQQIGLMSDTFANDGVWKAQPEKLLSALKLARLDRNNSVYGNLEILLRFPWLVLE